MTTDLCRLTATQALERLRAGALSARDCAQACLQRTAARDGEVRAWSHVDAAQVLAQAEALDAATPPAMGPLHGLPVGIKDVILTRDLPTQYNSPLYAGHAPQLDAACVSLLRSAGAVVFGKTDTVEFGATGRVAATRNPHRLGHTPGGSSSGSAAAVADFQVPLALGTQTGGSMMRPASYCGVWAIKPTWNLVSREGARMFAASLDTIGWFARSAADLGLLLDVYDPDATAAHAPFELAGARIALCRTPSWPLAEAATRQAMADAAVLLRAAGAQVSELELPAPFDALAGLQKLVMLSEGRSAFLADYRLHGQALHPSFRAQVENHAGWSRAALCHAHDEAARCRAAFDAIAAGFDAVLTPSATGEAPAGLEDTGSYAFNAMWSLLHTPCINVPGWRGPTGLPVGLTLTGPRFADQQLIAVARAIDTQLSATA